MLKRNVNSDTRYGLSPETYHAASELYREENRKFFELTGIDYRVG